MSVEIKITDPSTTKPEELRAVITFLSAFAGEWPKGGTVTTAHNTEVKVTPEVIASIERAKTDFAPVARTERVEPTPPIAPDDNPSAGAASVTNWRESNMQMAAIGTPTAAEVFAAVATIPAPHANDAAAIFGAVAPNVPAAPLASAPAPVAAPAPATNSVQLDKNGLPWDGRIHASTKATVQDGSWKKRRGVDDAEVARVEAELRQVMGIPNAPAAASPVAQVPAAPIAAPPSPPAAPSAPNVPAPTVPGNAPVVSVATIAAAHTPTATAHTAASAPPSSALTFPQLVPKITAAVQQGRLTQQQVLAACNANGLPSLPMLAARPDLVGAVAAALELS